MTPFFKDISNLFYCFGRIMVCNICYFFGHKWGEWKPYYGSPVGYLRECKRCNEFDHDRQRTIK